MDTVCVVIIAECDYIHTFSFHSVCGIVLIEECFSEAICPPTTYYLNCGSREFFFRNEQDETVISNLEKRVERISQLHTLSESTVLFILGLML